MANDKDMEEAVQQMLSGRQAAHDDYWGDDESHGDVTVIDENYRTNKGTRLGDTADAASSGKTGYGFGYSSDPEPVLDDDGEEIGSMEIFTALQEVNASLLRIDEEVQSITDPDQQARRARNLGKKLRKQRGKLEDNLRKARKWEDYCKAERDYGLSDEQNEAVADMVDDQAGWFHAEVDKLKDQLAERVRGSLDEMGEEVNGVRTRDQIYEDLTQAEVIEAWEPLEF